MLANERQERMKELIQRHKNLKVSELSRMLGVSEMTIHRDVKRLVEEGVAIKTFGGITLAQPKANDRGMSNECVYCHRPVNDRFSYRLILADNRVESACCCHCGLLRQHQLGEERVIQAICYDFLTHTTISTRSAWFVMDTSIDIRCCKPQVVPFDSREHAECFVKGFGGAVLTMQEAMERVLSQMTQLSGACHQHD